MLGIALEPVAGLETFAGPHVAFSPDGETLAVASWGHLELRCGHEPARTLEEPPGRHDRLAFSSDGSRLLHAPDAYELDGEAWAELGALGLPGGFELAGAAWAPDGRELAVASRYRPSRRGSGVKTGPTTRLALHDGETRAEAAVLHEGRLPESLATLLVGDRLVAAADVRVLVWDRATRELVASLTEHSRAVAELVTNSEGTLLASIAADGRVALWSTAGWGLERTWFAADDGRAIALHPRLPVLVTGGSTTVTVWSNEGRRLGGVEPGRLVGGLAFSPAGDLLAVAGQPPQTGVAVYRVTESRRA